MGSLFTPDRRRLVLPHRLISAIAALVQELAQQLDALGLHLRDGRWTEAAKRLHAVVGELSRPSEFYERIRLIEKRDAEAAAAAAAREAQRRIDEQLAELDKAERGRRREEQAKVHDELEAQRRRYLTRVRRVDREYERVPERGVIRLPPRKPVVFIRTIAARTVKR
jgi:phytoene dehydrogenase-like protein